MGKRIFLFLATNILIMATISLVTSILGIQPYLTAHGINYQSLMIFCLLWGFGGAFISLALSRVMAKSFMKVKVVNPDTAQPELRWLVDRIYQYSREAGLNKMPEVGVYESPELNAFATGPSRSRSLVAVSTGLLRNMNHEQVEGVLAHEVAHVANGDMVTMTLIQGVVNAFVMFFARIIAFSLSQFVRPEMRAVVHFITVIALDILLSFLGAIVVSYFSRLREFRADEGGARLAGRHKMISALQALRANSRMGQPHDEDALSTLKISGSRNKILSLLSTHPPLEIRIQKLSEMA
jgi:heat shock protein HtpX